jgi:hypothetical protein
MSYKNRGKWGNAKYRGNCSGWVVHDLLKHYKPKHFLEVFAGGGTGFEVARDLGYTESIHLDLNAQWGGWNALTDDIPEGSDFIFIHPPYHDIIQYSGVMWGDKPHPDDLSRCASYEEFIRKLNFVHAKAYASLRHGGRMAILIGDVKKNGRYFPIQKDMNWYGEMDMHFIKEQHNCMSDKNKYPKDVIRIVHEHLLVFRKEDIWMFPVIITQKVHRDIRLSEKVTWRDLVQAALESLGGTATLPQLYQVIESTKKAENNKHWKEKVRQTLQMYRDFECVKRGCWSFADSSRHAA